LTGKIRTNLSIMELKLSKAFHSKLAIFAREIVP
jgi:hypothetical protein